MKLSKLFLTKALPGASYYHGRVAYDAINDDLWRKVDQLRDVNVALDSRSVEASDLFIALKGAKVDGHDFIADVLAQGACGALIAQDRVTSHLLNIDEALTANKLFIVVENTEVALLTMARTRRDELTIPVVGVTGSVGKTTTKEMLRAMLHEAGIPAFVSFKNYNTVLGVSYNLLRIPESAHVAVIEMGINGVGEMQQLADIVQPSLAVITNIGHAHVGHLGGSLHGVAHEKRLIFSRFKADGVGVIHGDQELLTEVHYNHPVAKFGLKTKNQVQARKVHVELDEHNHPQTHFILKWYGEKSPVILKNNHPGNVANALAAATVAYFLKIPFAAVVRALTNYVPFENRFEPKKLKHNKGHLLSDCYNANPENMKAALVAFAQLPAKGPKVLILGEMFELGDRQDYWHRQVSRELAKVSDLGVLITVGSRAQLYAKMLPRTVKVHTTDNWQQALDAFNQHVDAQDALVLVKGGRSLRLENMIKEVVE
ncbi:UDP-N-acetylmuramoyl-tripeptide--D-alanyl-D-alanine ligase [Candidatus Dependentiae bacterium]|nr:UDP-N-acetylmuramoyl-tripeptide--D-alanyl-D-alanine ligase [Candidatus Dependentiae bacterium]